MTEVEEEFRVICITTDVEEYPEYAADTEEFPHLLDRVEDDFVTLVLDSEGNDCPASEFFNMVDVKKFTAVVANK